MKELFIILFISLFFYFIFFKKRIIPIESMKNTEIHKKDDYNIFEQPVSIPTIDVDIYGNATRIHPIVP